MKIKNKLLLLAIASVFPLSHLHAFTMLYSNPPRFKTAVEIIILGEDCNNVGVTKEQIRNDVKYAVNAFWNRIHSSTMRFIVREDFVGLSGGGSMLLTDMLSVTPENKVLVACSDNATMFTSPNILAGTRMSNTEPAKSAIAINNIVGSAYATLSEEQRRSTLAHELGHAFGLGHTSHRDALMYYAAVSDVKVRHLSPDDADGSTYLYPKKSKFLGLIGGCGLIKDVGSDSHKGGGNGREILALLAELFLLVALYFVSKKISFSRLAKFMASR